MTVLRFADPSYWEVVVKTLARESFWSEAFSPADRSPGLIFRFFALFRFFADAVQKNLPKRLIKDGEEDDHDTFFEFRFLDATLRGDTEALETLVKENDIDRVCFNIY